jgi:hypothetical protein
MLAAFMVGLLHRVLSECRRMARMRETDFDWRVEK